MTRKRALTGKWQIPIGDATRIYQSKKTFSASDGAAPADGCLTRARGFDNRPLIVRQGMNR